MVRLWLQVAGLVLALVGCGGGGGSSDNDNGGLRVIDNPGLQFYGWYAQDYTAADNDLAELASYTDTLFASDLEQARLAVEAGFRHIFYRYEHYHILEWMTEIPIEPEAFRASYFQAYRAFLEDLRTRLIETGLYVAVDYFFILDEPALRRDTILDQAFLDQYVAEFDQVFPDKYSAIAFAEDPNGDGVRRGPHLAAPPTVDVIIMDPYFWTNDLPCDPAVIRDYLYEGNPNSNLNWAFQFGKPVMLAGDAMLRRDGPPRSCYIDETYRIVSEDERITGLVWFIYDAGFATRDGALRGASNDPAFVAYIKGLNTVAE